MLEERVIQVSYDPMRKAMIAMTGWSDKLRWQIATDKMKEGDIIRTHTNIPKNPIPSTLKIVRHIYPTVGSWSRLNVLQKT